MPHPPVTQVTSSISFQVSETIANGVITTAREYNTLPLSVVVLDSGGQLVNFKREDGCSLLRADISFGKALVAGRKRVPRPATGNTALRTVWSILWISIL